MDEISTLTRQLLGLTPNLNYTTGLICSTILCITGISCLLLLEYGIRTRIIPTTTTMPILSRGLQILFGCLFVFSLTYSLTGWNTVQTAKKHGMFQDDMTWSKMIDCIDNSPIEDELPDNLANSIILYFKFGCADCEATYNQQLTTFGDLDNVYWVSTRSEQGKQLMKKYPIKEVPTGVYITDDLKPVTCILHMKKQGEIVLHEANAQTLLNLYNGSHKNK